MKTNFTVVSLPGTERWCITDRHAQVIASRILGPRGPASVCIEYWPRARAGEAWARDQDNQMNDPTLDIGTDACHPYRLRGYSFATPERGSVAVIFVDDRETYESATFVALHELAHLLVAEDDDDEIHADLIASVMMPELGYGEGIREARRGRDSP